MRRKIAAWSLVGLGLLAFATPGNAEIKFFGTAKVKPTYFNDFNFDSSKPEGPIITEGGVVKGEFMRSELRLGWTAAGDNWTVKMIAEGDIIMNKDNVDRSFYAYGDNPNYDDNGKELQPNTGAEFGIERAELTYKFLPALELETGWDIRALDIKTGGLLYGDDHPFIGFRGKIAKNLRYEALYLPIQNQVPLQTDPGGSSEANDWRVYSAKLEYDLGQRSKEMPASPFYANSDVGLTISPLYAFSDNRNMYAQIHYYGAEVTGQTGPLKPYFEIIRADGDFDNGPDISSWAMFAGAEVPVAKAFNPYIAFRYTQGDNNRDDNKVKGFVGITDIGRFSGLMGMDGNVLGDDIGQSYGATLYSYSPERFYTSFKKEPEGAADLAARYGGISNQGSGDNPGQKLVAIGARGDLASLLPGLLYKTQAFFIWYDETGNLIHKDNTGQKVDSYAGTTFDLQVLYAFSKNFSADYIFSTFLPGDGIKDQFGDDAATVNMLTLAWSY